MLASNVSSSFVSCFSCNYCGANLSNFGLSTFSFVGVVALITPPIYLLCYSCVGFLMLCFTNYFLTFLPL
uniref:Putative ovule protein n=1 Tax=Solanum chacoense TaxID=4108 RepID=A0A0V0I7H8_SOLCH